MSANVNMKSMTDLYIYLIIFLYYQLIFQSVKCDANFHQQGGHIRICDHWQLLTLHSCVIHTSRIEFWWLQTWYCLSFYSYLALINYSYPLANEIIGKFCRVSALTPAFVNRDSSFISVWKACARWYVVRSIAFSFNRWYYRSLTCSQIIKKERQECLTSDNNNSTIADLPKKA